MTIKTEKFNTLTPGYYKLVDKEGWLASYPPNGVRLSCFDNNLIILIDGVSPFGGGFHGDSSCIIVKRDYKFFEKVVSEYPLKQSITNYDVEELSKIDAPFGELDKLTKLQLVEAREDGEQIEVLSATTGWNMVVLKGSWCSMTIYRVKPRMSEKEVKKLELQKQLDEMNKEFTQKADVIKKQIAEL